MTRFALIGGHFLLEIGISVSNKRENDKYAHIKMFQYFLPPKHSLFTITASNATALPHIS